jgi:hypothetical protein
MDRPNSRRVHAAVIEVDNTKLVRHSGVDEGTAAHLRPAGEKLEDVLHRTLQWHPDSELARNIKELIDHEKLFYVVGKWPPNSGTQSSPVATLYCRHCGKPNP